MKADPFAQINTSNGTIYAEYGSVVSQVQFNADYSKSQTSSQEFVVNGQDFSSVAAAQRYVQTLYPNAVITPNYSVPVPKGFEGPSAPATAETAGAVFTGFTITTTQTSTAGQKPAQTNLFGQAYNDLTAGYATLFRTEAQGGANIRSLITTGRLAPPVSQETFLGVNEKTAESAISVNAAYLTPVAGPALHVLGNPNEPIGAKGIDVLFAILPVAPIGEVAGLAGRAAGPLADYVGATSFFSGLGVAGKTIVRIGGEFVSGSAIGATSSYLTGQNPIRGGIIGGALGVIGSEGLSFVSSSGGLKGIYKTAFGTSPVSTTSEFPLLSQYKTPPQIGTPEYDISPPSVSVKGEGFSTIFVEEQGEVIVSAGKTIEPSTIGNGQVTVKTEADVLSDLVVSQRDLQSLSGSSGNFINDITGRAPVKVSGVENPENFYASLSKGAQEADLYASESEPTARATEVQNLLDRYDAETSGGGSNTVRSSESSGDFNLITDDNQLFIQRLRNQIENPQTASGETGVSNVDFAVQEAKIQFELRLQTVRSIARKGSGAYSPEYLFLTTPESFSKISQNVSLSSITKESSISGLAMDMSLFNNTVSRVSDVTKITPISGLNVDISQIVNQIPTSLTIQNTSLIRDQVTDLVRVPVLDLAVGQSVIQLQGYEYRFLEPEILDFPRLFRRPKTRKNKKFSYGVRKNPLSENILNEPSIASLGDILF